MLDQQTLSIHDERIKASDDIIYFEPYKSNFIKGEQHIIESFCELTGIEYNKQQPKLYTEHLQVKAIEALRGVGKYIIVQFTGGQTLANQSGHYQSIDPGRNYPEYFAQKLCALIKKKYPNYTIINYSLPGEPVYPDTIRLEIPYIIYHEILKGAESFIAIDSSLNHMSASAQKKGVVLWGSTRPEQFGYDHNENLSNGLSKDDPRNIMVEPERILECLPEN